jgi:nucleoside triphosphatase
MQRVNVKVKGIVRCDDRILIIKHWYDDRIEDPYQWEFIDGNVDFGENPERAVLRIMNAGAGTECEISKILYTWSNVVGCVHTVGICYGLITKSQDILLSEEYNEYKWVKKTELADYIENRALMDDVTKVLDLL